MSWIYQDQPVDQIDPQYCSFVYKITNLVDGRVYIGYKQTTFAKTKQVKGKKKRIRVESDWRDYWSSSEQLQSDVARMGQAKFKREILYFCKSKAMGRYLELCEQMRHKVLECPDRTYNRIINVRINTNHLAKVRNEIAQLLKESEISRS